MGRKATAPTPLPAITTIFKTQPNGFHASKPAK